MTASMRNGYLSLYPAESGLLAFFLQAEDGIRAHCVTGVQTCALPIYRGEAGARRHDVAGAPLVERKDALQDLRLAAVELTFLSQTADQLPQLLEGRLLRVTGGWRAAKQAHNRVRSIVEDDDQRTQRAMEELERQRAEHGHRPGRADRKALRRLLTDRDVQSRHGQDREHAGDRRREMGERHRVQERLDQAREGRFTDRAERERRDGDPELAGRQVLVELFLLAPREASSKRIASKLSSSNRDQRELGRDEKSVDQNERRDRSQSKPGHLGATVASRLSQRESAESARRTIFATAESLRRRASSPMAKLDWMLLCAAGRVRVPVPILGEGDECR